MFHHGLLVFTRMETEEGREQQRQSYATRRTFSLRALKTREDWNEWQANAIGAALLIPMREIQLVLDQYAPNQKLICYEDKFTNVDQRIVTTLCHILAVSYSALVIRLRHLGVVENRPYSEYIAPLEVWP